MPAAYAGLIYNGYNCRLGRHCHCARGAHSHAGEAPDAPIWIYYEFQKEPAAGGSRNGISPTGRTVVKLDSVKKVGTLYLWGLFQVVLLDLPIQGSFPNSEGLCSLPPVALVLLQSGVDGCFFDICHGHSGAVEDL